MDPARNFNGKDEIMGHKTSTLQSNQAFRWKRADVVVMEEFLNNNDINSRAALHGADLVPLIDSLFTHKYYGLITDNGEAVMSLVDKKVISKLEDILRKRGSTAAIDQPLDAGVSRASNQPPTTRSPPRAVSIAASITQPVTLSATSGTDKSAEESGSVTDYGPSDSKEHTSTNSSPSATYDINYKNGYELLRQYDDLEATSLASNATRDETSVAQQRYFQDQQSPFEDDHHLSPNINAAGDALFVMESSSPARTDPTSLDNTAMDDNNAPECNTSGYHEEHRDDKLVELDGLHRAGTSIGIPEQQQPLSVISPIRQPHPEQGKLSAEPKKIKIQTTDQEPRIHPEDLGHPSYPKVLATVPTRHSTKWVSHHESAKPIIPPSQVHNAPLRPQHSSTTTHRHELRHSGDPQAPSEIEPLPLRPNTQSSGTGPLRPSRYAGSYYQGDHGTQPALWGNYQPSVPCGPANVRNALPVSCVEQLIESVKEDIEREKHTKSGLKMTMCRAELATGRKQKALMELRRAAAEFEAEKSEVEKSLRRGGPEDAMLSRTRLPGEWPEL